MNFCLLIDYSPVSVYNECMICPAEIRIITMQEDDRYEFFTGGTVELGDNDAAYITFTAGVSEMIIGLSGDTATVTKLGSDGYTLIASPSRTHPLSLGGMDISVFTDKLLTRRRQGRIDVLLQYRFLMGENQSIRNRLRLRCTFDHSLTVASTPSP